MNARKAKVEKVEPVEQLEPVEPIKDVVEAEPANELLVLVEGQLTGEDIFTGEKVLETMLAMVHDELWTVVSDVETAEGRKQIAARAYTASRCKVAIDNFGKDLVADQKAKVKVIDDRRKYAREYLEALRDEILAPKEAWEAEQERKAQAEADAAKYVADVEEAYALHDLFLREEKVRAQEARLAELEAKEAEAKRREEEAVRIKAAEERARADAEAAAERKVQEAEERARKAQEQAAEQARQAVEDERIRKAQQEERERIAREKSAELAQREEQARAANIEHRRGINNRIVERLQHYGFTLEQAQQLVTLIATGKIPSTEIRY